MKRSFAHARSNASHPRFAGDLGTAGRALPGWVGKFLGLRSSGWDGG